MRILRSIHLRKLVLCGTGVILLGVGVYRASSWWSNYRAIQAERADLPEARRKIQERGFFQAKELLSKDGRPRTAEGYCLLALATDSLRNSPPLVRKALELDPRNREAFALLVRLYDADHTVERSPAEHVAALQQEIRDFSLVGKESSEYAGALYRKAAARLELLRVGGPVSNLEPAQAELDEALALVEQTREPAVTAMVYYQLGRLANLRAAAASASTAPQFRAKAAQYLRRATELNPSQVEAWAELAKTLRATGEASSALASLEDAAGKLKNDRDRSRLWNLIGALYLEARNPAKAQDSLAEAIRFDPANGGAYVALARLQQATGNAREAEQTLNTCLKAVPELLEAETLLSQIYFATRRPDEAVRILEKVVSSADARSLTPGDHGQRVARYRALLWLAYLYLNHQKRPREAERAAEFAMRLHEGDPELLDLRGWIQHRLGNEDQAMALLSELTARAPGYPMAHFHLAQIYDERKNRAKALEELNAALGATAPFPERRAAEAMRARLAAGPAH